MSYKNRTGVIVKPYDVEFVKQYADVINFHAVGERRSSYDKYKNYWRLEVVLENSQTYFLSVFIGDDGELQHYSLDEQLADDSHYSFIDEQAIRSMVYEKGDEDKYLDEILVKFIKKLGKAELVRVVSSICYEEFHYY